MNDFSKTDSPCDCGWLALAINDSTSGVSFDAEENRICLRNEHSYYPFYHCPACGGAYPDPEKPMWIPIVPPEEFDRLKELIRELPDAESILNLLGPPDYDALMDPTARVRNIEYYRLSDWLNIEFYITLDRPPEGRLTIKRLSARTKSDGEPSRRPKITGTT